MFETWLVLARYQCRPPGTKGKMQARHNLRRRIKQIMALDDGDIRGFLDIELMLPDDMYRSFLLSLDRGRMPALDRIDSPYHPADQEGKK